MSYNTRALVERKSVTQDPVYGTEVVTWVPLGDAWCELQDVMPSRDERVRANIDMSAVRTRIRCRYRSDIDSSMRFIIMRPHRTIWSIIGGPAMVGNKRDVEFLCERASS